MRAIANFLQLTDPHSTLLGERKLNAALLTINDFCLPIHNSRSDSLAKEALRIRKYATYELNY
jgi:hypothetical protein